MERKWTDKEYHIKDNADIEHKHMKMCCNRNQFPALPFCVHIPKIMAQGG